MAKRREKKPSEWKKAYRDKADFMAKKGFVEVTPHEFYRDLFPVGTLQSSSCDDKGKGNIIATRVRTTKRGRSRQFVVHDDLVYLDAVIGDPFGLIAPISYFGKTHSKSMAHELFAIAIDIDYVGLRQLKNLMKQFNNGVQLEPTYLVSSGKGVHLYYFLDEPIPLYHNLEGMLRELKEAMIRRYWNDTSSLRPDSPDIAGIYQAFRCVGSQSKLGPEYPVRAWRISGRRYTLEDLKSSIPDCKIDVSIVKKRPTAEKTSRMTLEEAKKAYPEWYDRKIVKGIPNTNKWTCSPALYEWWKRKINSEVKEGGRYFSILALCAYGLKCGIPEKTIRHDAYALCDYLDSLTEEEDNHFTKKDVQDALKSLTKSKRDLTYYSTRKWLEEHTKVSIPPSHRPKGKRLKQADHLKMARLMCDMRHPNGAWRNDGGAPTKDKIVKEWQIAHPGGRKIDCERDTGLSRHTVLKWWDK